MAEAPTGEPIYMLNVLWFQPEVGEARYREYLRAVRDVSTRYGGKKLDSYVPEQALIGEWDADLIFFVRWPDWDTFQKFLADPQFQAVHHLREEALAHSLLIRCRKAG
jgi:uncharacterized protein (DUF1330 family)